MITVAALMAARWWGETEPACRFLRRACVVVFGVAGLVTLLMSASTTLVKALGALRGEGRSDWCWDRSRWRCRTSFISRPCLLPRAIARAWTNTLDGDDGAVAKDAKDDGAPKTPEELAKEKRKKCVNLLLGLAAFGATMATGSDAPLFILFAFQLFKVDPEELMNAVINKGSLNASRWSKRLRIISQRMLPGSRGESTPTGKTNGAESSSESASGDDTGAPASA